MPTTKTCSHGPEECVTLLGTWVPEMMQRSEVPPPELPPRGRRDPAPHGQPRPVPGLAIIRSMLTAPSFPFLGSRDCLPLRHQVFCQERCEGSLGHEAASLASPNANSRPDPGSGFAGGAPKNAKSKRDACPSIPFDCGALTRMKERSCPMTLPRNSNP